MKLIPMQIPFADAVLSRLGRREAGLELIEQIEDEAVDSVDTGDLLSNEPALPLQPDVKQNSSRTDAVDCP
jgi:hypothetical protein